jgi:hypothetical protein
VLSGDARTGCLPLLFAVAPRPGDMEEKPLCSVADLSCDQVSGGGY